MWRGMLSPEEYAAFILQFSEGFSRKEVWTAHLLLRLFFPILAKDVREAIRAASPAQDAIARDPQRIETSMP